MTAHEIPLLPLLLWRTPPGVEHVLMQEGVPFRTLADLRPSSLSGGRFVLFDGRAGGPREFRSALAPGQVAIDVDVARRSSGEGDPFAAMIDARAVRKTWTIDGVDVTERVSLRDKADARRRVIAAIRSAVTGAGGVWARLARYPHPFRSAFNFRADLDERCPDDFARFASALRPIEDCSTLFVSTRAYADEPEVLATLRKLDAQSHGHHHFVYRDETANRRNLARADRLLRDRGIAPCGFAAPGGRWNAGLDRAIENLGYAYSSDFHLGYDDDPFYPWRPGGFSRILQVPIHPICEGLFLDAGSNDPNRIARHLITTVRAKAGAGESAFVYGHPERRLGRFPEVVSALARAASDLDRTWRVTLTEFARWWTWRSRRSWSLSSRGDGVFEARFDGWDASFPVALEVVQGDGVATIPLTDERRAFRPDDLIFTPRPAPADRPRPRRASPEGGWRSALRSALDWETVTPVEDLPESGVRDRIKKRLRLLRGGAA